MGQGNDRGGARREFRTSTNQGTPLTGDAGEQHESLGTLFAGILKDLQDLLRGEIQLAKTEIRQEVASAGKGVGALAAGAFIGLVGFMFLMLAVTYLLNKWVQMWIAAGIVAVALLIIAAILAMSGKRKVSATNLKPDQTIESLKEDREWAKDQISSVKR